MIEIDYQKVAGSFTLDSNLGESVTGTIIGTGALDFSVDAVAAGDYTISLIPKGQASIEFLTLLVKCKADESTDPMLSKCWTSAGQNGLTIQGDDPDKLIIYGQVTQGSNPVLDAAITAEISDEKGEVSTLLLKDDGLSPDIIKDDGIYSGFYIPSGFTDDGSRYSLACKMSGTNETSFVNTTSNSEKDIWFKGKSFPSKPTSTTPMCCGSQGIKVEKVLSIVVITKLFSQDDVSLSPTGAFTRSNSGGVITVKGKDGGNVYPPGTIRDLLILDIVEGQSFNLSFTSPGDDLNSGNLTQYIIFYSANRTHLDNLTPTSTISNITTDMLSHNTSMESVPPFTKVNLRVDKDKLVTMADTEYYFRVLAIDSGEKTSKSNVVVSSLGNIYQVCLTSHSNLHNMSVLFIGGGKEKEAVRWGNCWNCDWNSGRCCHGCRWSFLAQKEERTVDVSHYSTCVKH